MFRKYYKAANDEIKAGDELILRIIDNVNEQKKISHRTLYIKRAASVTAAAAVIVMAAAIPRFNTNDGGIILTEMTTENSVKEKARDGKAQTDKNTEPETVSQTPDTKANSEIQAKNGQNTKTQAKPNSVTEADKNSGTSYIMPVENERAETDADSIAAQEEAEEYISEEFANALAEPPVAGEELLAEEETIDAAAGFYSANAKAASGGCPDSALAVSEACVSSAEVIIGEGYSTAGDTISVKGITVYMDYSDGIAAGFSYNGSDYRVVSYSGDYDAVINKVYQIIN